MTVCVNHSLYIAFCVTICSTPHVHKKQDWPTLRGWLTPKDGGSPRVYAGFPSPFPNTC